MIKVVFFATPEIAVNSLKKLLNFADIHIVGVVTQPDRPAGRGKKIIQSPVKEFALGLGMPVFQSESIRKDKELIEKLKALNPDFFVTFAFGQILSQEILDIPQIATVNLHASLLPKYRGANPIQRAIYNGDKMTGITTMLTILELDAGDICLTEDIEITENMTVKELSEIVSDKSPFLIYRTLKGLSSKTLIPRSQCEGEVCFADKCKKEEARINWSSTSESIHNKVRAFFESSCALTIFNGKFIKIAETRLIEDTVEKIEFKPSQIIAISKIGIEVKTGDASILVTKVQPECKPVMNAFDWSNGARVKVGDSFMEVS